MPKVTTNQTSFNAGELDPQIRSREDVKFYYMGCGAAENVEFFAQGGFRRRGGLRRRSRVRGILESIEVDVGMVTLGGQSGGGDETPPDSLPGFDPPTDLPPGYDDPWRRDFVVIP